MYRTFIRSLRWTLLLLVDERRGGLEQMSTGRSCLDRLGLRAPRHEPPRAKDTERDEVDRREREQAVEAERHPRVAELLKDARRSRGHQPVNHRPKGDEEQHQTDERGTRAARPSSRKRPRQSPIQIEMRANQGERGKRKKEEEHAHLAIERGGRLTRCPQGVNVETVPSVVSPRRALKPPFQTARRSPQAPFPPLIPKKTHDSEKKA